MIRNIIILLFSLPFFAFSQEEFIQFKCKNKLYKAQGYVNSFEFEDFNWDSKNPESIKATILIDLSSISEKSEKLVNHLKNEDFFDIKIHPNARITIDSVVIKSDTIYLTTGLMTVRGIEKEMSLTFQLNKEKTQIIGFTTFSRFDFDINKKNKSIDETVYINFQVNIPEQVNQDLKSKNKNQEVPTQITDSTEKKQ